MSFICLSSCFLWSWYIIELWQPFLIRLDSFAMASIWPYRTKFKNWKVDCDDEETSKWRFHAHYLIVITNASIIGQRLLKVHDTIIRSRVSNIGVANFKHCYEQHRIWNSQWLLCCPCASQRSFMMSSQAKIRPCYYVASIMWIPLAEDEAIEKWKIYPPKCSERCLKTCPVCQGLGATRHKTSACETMARNFS